MGQNVQRVLSELHRDHRNMGLCLSILEREANRIYDNGEMDIELMHDVMTYMTGYPDAVHHPRENRLYSELKNTHPELSPGFSQIYTDHKTIAEQGLKLRDEFEGAAAGSAVRRKTLVADALRYVETLRSHMRWEESDLFRRCEALVDNDREVDLDDDEGAGDDPLFGRQAEARFAKLFACIEEANRSPSEA